MRRYQINPLHHKSVLLIEHSYSHVSIALPCVCTCTSCKSLLPLVLEYTTAQYANGTTYNCKYGDPRYFDPEEEVAEEEEAEDPVG